MPAFDPVTGRRDNRRFQPGAGPTYICRNCGIRTRETGQDESSAELCRLCNALAMTENTHSDEGHPGMEHDCSQCAWNFIGNGGRGTIRAEEDREAREYARTSADGPRRE